MSAAYLVIVNDFVEIEVFVEHNGPLTSVNDKI